MLRSTRRQLILVTLSILLTLIGVWTLSHKLYTPLLVPGWILAIVSILIAAWPKKKRPQLPHFGWKEAGILFLILIPILVRIANYQPERIHGDDLLTASFSMGFHPRTANFFAGVPEVNIWVAKFPAPYFLFQKIFLRVAGADILTVKLSILPYVAIVSGMTYAIASLIISPFAGGIAVLLYAFMAVSLYHETLGLHFVSSTAIFLIFFYSLLRAKKSARPFWHALTGMAAAGCYFFYTSSYIAIPIFLIALLLDIRKPMFLWKNLAWTLLGIIVTLAPFLTYAVTTENYFTGRIDQVSLLTGTWSNARVTTLSIPTVFTVIAQNTVLAARSLVYDGIGGHGGYVFGHRAFFNPVGLVLCISGVILNFWIVKKRIDMLLILSVLVISFITGMALTIPPPAYQRLTLTFPFIAIVSAVSVIGITKLAKKRTALLVSGIIIALYTGTNLAYFRTSVVNETKIGDAAVIDYINIQYPGRMVHIAAFPQFALGKFYPFFPHPTARSIDTKYHAAYLEHFNTEEKYLYIITLPNDFRDKFMEKDPKGIYIPYSEKYGIFVN